MKNLTEAVNRVKLSKFFEVEKSNEQVLILYQLIIRITADKNRIPIKIKADIIVGSIRIDLESFSNLNNPFEIKFD